MASRTVELLVQVVDNASANIARIQGSLSSMLGPYKTLIAGAAGIATLGGAFRKFVAESSEAEEALARFDLAFKNLGANVGVPKAAMVSFAEEVQRTTAFSDESVLELQATLLRFGTVTGATFERTRDVVVDVAAALRMDLGSAAQTVGRALENPAQGMRMLRSMGVVLSESQQDVVKNLVETGRTADAQKLILDELSKRYKGAAEVAGNTFTGALAKLKNAWGEVFEGPDKLGPIKESLGDLTRALQDPGFKNAVQDSIGALITALQTVLSLFTKITQGWQNIAWLFGAGRKSEGGQAFKISGIERTIETLEAAKASGFDGPDSTPQRIKDSWLKGIDEALVAARASLKSANAELMTMMGHGPRAEVKSPAPVKAMDPVLTDEQKKALDEAKKKWQETMTGIYDAAGTELDKVQRKLAETRTAVSDAFRAGLIDEGQMHELFRVAGEGSGEAYMKALNESVEPMMEAASKQMADELEHAMDGVKIEIPPVEVNIKTEELMQAEAAVDSFVDALTSGLQNAAQQGKLSMKSLVQFMISQLLSQALSNAIKNLGESLKAAMGSGSSGGGGGWASAAGSFIGSIFGMAGGGFAAGGMAHAAAGGMTLVGEEGPELVALPKGSRVHSNSVSKQMASANVTYAPVQNIAIVAKDTDAQTLRAEFSQMLSRNNALMRNETVEMLHRNGLGRMR